MSWRDKLEVRRAEIFQNCPAGELTKLPEPPFVSFGSTQDGRFQNIQQPHAAQQTARLLDMLLAQSLPESLIAQDDAGTDELAAMDAGELQAYALALHRSATMDAGTVPREYTQAAKCEECGPVWLWATCPPVVKACPWCFRRRAGKAIPRPSLQDVPDNKVGANTDNGNVGEARDD